MTTDLQELRDSVRTGRKVLSLREQLALIDLALSARAAARLAQGQAAKAMSPEFFGPDLSTDQPPSPARLPGDATG